MRIVIGVAMVVLVSAACSFDKVGGQPQADGSRQTTTAVSSGSTSTTTSSATSSSSQPLTNVEACPLLDPTKLPAAWQPLKTNPKPILQFGESNCEISNGETSLGVSIVIYRGPGRGIDELSRTVASPPVPIDISGRAARMYRDTGGNTCGILFDFGPDQGLVIIGSPAIKSTDDPCVVVTTAATVMAPNLPPS